MYRARICTLAFFLLACARVGSLGAQTTLSTLNFPDPHVGAALTTDDYGYISDWHVGTKPGDEHNEVQWVNYLTKFVSLNGAAPVEIKNGSANLALWDNVPAAPVAGNYFIPGRFEDWSYDAVNSPNVWHSVIEYENGGEHIIGAVGYKLLDPSPTLGSPYAELLPAYQFTNVAANNAVLKTIHYERSAQVGNTVYCNQGGNQWDYDNSEGTSDDFAAVSSAVSTLPYLSFAGFPLERYRIQSSAGNLLNELQTAGANYNLANSTVAVLNATPEIGYQVSEITLAPGEAVLYWLYPKPIKVVNTAAYHPTNIDHERKDINATGVDYVFNNTDVSIDYSALTYVINGAGVTATLMQATVAEITGGVVASGVSGELDHVSTVRYWEIFYDTRRASTVADITFTYDPASDGIDDENTLTLAYRTDYSQDWTQWQAIVQDQANNTLTALSVHLDDSQWILASTTGNNPLPVELISFSAAAGDGEIILRWETATETDNFGFDIERSVDQQQWRKIGFVAGHGTTALPQTYIFSDTDVTANRYFYRLKQIDRDGQFEYSEPTEVVLAAPNGFELAQNYPNPFNPATTIPFTVPEAGDVTLSIYDIGGRQIRNLVRGRMSAGQHKVAWDGRDDAGRTVASGMFLYELEAGAFRQVRKLLLLR
ncbi:MAG: FlgD immunoglobulin-like domain containing protein [bacterium]